MTEAEAGRIVAWLNAAFPRDALEPESFAIWVTEVGDLGHYESGLDAAKTIGRNGDRFPTIKEYRAAYRQAFERWLAGRELPEADDTVPPPDEFRDLFARAGVRSIDDLPYSTKIHARPVWERFLSRLRMSLEHGGGEIHEPTDSEIHDAILVLAEEYQGRDVDGDVLTELHREAQRIMDECSA